MDYVQIETPDVTKSAKIQKLKDITNSLKKEKQDKSNINIIRIIENQQINKKRINSLLN